LLTLHGKVLTKYSSFHWALLLPEVLSTRSHSQVLPKMGITATVIDPSDMGALERVLEERTVSLFFSESPTNPYLRCVDVRCGQL